MAKSTLYMGTRSCMALGRGLRDPPLTREGTLPLASSYITKERGRGSRGEGEWGACGRHRATGCERQ